MAGPARPTAEDRRWMAMALGLARRSQGRVAPNPTVCALLVRDGRLIARGLTARGGRPHAEAVAIAAARAAGRGDALAGATAYVTLEPCAHHGLTPPCAEALAAAGIARVVSPITDPDPRVAGQGFALLEAAGIVVETGVLAAEARAVNAGFLSRITRGRPHVTLKLATTLDGRIATGAGESRWITGPEARRRVHALRARSDAVLIGSGTARADDPMLDIRGFGADAPRPLRVVADSDLSLAPGARLVRTARAHPLLLAHAEDAEKVRADALRAAGASLLALPRAAAGPGLDLARLLGALGDRGITRLMCEGGGGLAASLVSAGLADTLWLFTAGRVIGAEGQPGIGPMGLGRLADAPGFVLSTVEPVGADTLTIWERRDRGA